MRGVLRDMAANPNHELRQRINTALGSYAHRLQTDTALGAQVEAALANVGKALQTEGDLQNRVDAWLVAATSLLARHTQAEVSQVIAATVSRWDADDTSARVERRIGRDLQFIRINGTIIGALAGLAIHLLKTVI